MWSDIKWLIKPRWFRMDKWLVSDLEKYTGVRVRRKKGPKGDMLVFSWSWLWLEFWKNWKLFREQKWWTSSVWKKEKKTAKCPKCGDRNFDID
jgi:hypothetical protein